MSATRMHGRRSSPWLLAVLMVSAGIGPGSEAFYVPGVAPQDFAEGDEITVRAIKMTSSRTQLPYEYYSLPFCMPLVGEISYKSQNLGEILRGDRITDTAYVLNMNSETDCKMLCNDPQHPQTWNEEESDDAVEKIRDGYFVHFIVDNLPCATKFTLPDDDRPQYEPGYRLGFVKDGEAYINNHLRLIMKYHKDPASDVRRVVGCQVLASSISLEARNEAESKGCPTSAEPQPIVKHHKNRLLFSYDVTWEESDIRWASRWDIYLQMSNVQIHWFSIINSMVVVIFLSSVVAMIIIKTLRRDIAKYNTIEDMEESAEETGWKLVHGDVFRPPTNSRLFVSIVGSGVQIFTMISMTIFFAMLGMLSPASRGSLLTAAIFVYEFMGLVAGYFAGRLYRTLKGKEWRKAAFLTATLYPGVIFGMGFFVNLFIWGQRSSGAIPFATMLSMCAMWFGISVPLTFFGYYFGYKKQSYEHPVRTNQIPRQVPEQPWYLGLVSMALLAGFLPFGACFLELFFIFSAIYENQFYYLFGFLFMVFMVLVVTCSEISIVMVYFMLCSENYHWWWSSLIVSGSSAIYVFGYSLVYFCTRLNIDEFIPTMVYFTYSIMLAVTFWFVTGTIGFFAAYFFVRKIYASVKID